MTVPASGATSSLTLTKSTTPTGYTAAGQTLTYDYLVTNTGTTTISSIAVSDNLVPSVSCPHPTLAPRASETCTGTYTTTQTDVDTGSVTNTATASGTDPYRQPGHLQPVHGDRAGQGWPPRRCRSPSRPPPRATAAAGQTLTYDYLVTNTGTTTMSSIAVSDNLMPRSAARTPTLAPAGLGDLHRDLHDHPARRRHRLGDQHRHRLGNEPLQTPRSPPTRRR